MPKTSRREVIRHKRRYGPTTTNPGLRIIQRELAAKAAAIPCDDCHRTDGSHNMNVEH